MRSALATASSAGVRSAAARAGDSRRGFLILAVLAGPLGALALAAAARWGLHFPQPDRTAPTLVLFLLIAPVLEEIVFRGGLQEMLDRTAFGRLAPVGNVTVANVATSALFAAAHLASAPLWLAVAVFLPSLVLGRVKQLDPSLLPVVLLHAGYNGCYLCLAAGWRPPS